MADSDSTLGSSQDYASLQLWIDAKDGETGTHTGQGKNEVITGNSLLNNASTAATAFILKPQADAYHDGRSRDVSGTGCQIAYSAGNAAAIRWFSTNGATLTVEDLNIKNSNTGDSAAAFSAETNAGATIVRRCILQINNANCGAWNLLGVGATHKLYDSIAYGKGRGADCRSSTNSLNEIKGCTFDGQELAAFGVLPGTACAGLQNTIAVAYTSECYFGDDNTDANHKNNIADDDTVSTEYDGGGGSVNNATVYVEGDIALANYVAFKSRTAGSEDYHIVTLAGIFTNLALASGVAGAGSGFDIDRQARSSPPNIGADDPTPSGGGPTIAYSDTMIGGRLTKQARLAA